MLSSLPVIFTVFGTFIKEAEKDAQKRGRDIIEYLQNEIPKLEEKFNKLSDAFEKFKKERTPPADNDNSADPPNPSTKSGWKIIHDQIDIFDDSLRDVDRILKQETTIVNSLRGMRNWSSLIVLATLLWSVLFFYLSSSSVLSTFDAPVGILVAVSYIFLFDNGFGDELRSYRSIKRLLRRSKFIEK